MSVRTSAPWFGFVSWDERRQADRFFAELAGLPFRPPLVSPVENVVPEPHHRGDRVRLLAAGQQAEGKARAGPNVDRSLDQHSRAIQDEMRRRELAPGQLVAGHKKDVVLAKALHWNPRKIAFHGFYRGEYPYEPCYDNPEGKLNPNCNRESPILAHCEGRVRFSDYSQGVRLVHPFMRIDGVKHLVEDVLKDKTLSKHISSEGEIVPPRIPAPPSR